MSPNNFSIRPAGSLMPPDGKQEHFVAGRVGFDCVAHFIATLNQIARRQRIMLVLVLQKRYPEMLVLRLRVVAHVLDSQLLLVGVIQIILDSYRCDSLLRVDLYKL